MKREQVLALYDTYADNVYRVALGYPLSVFRGFLYQTFFKKFALTFSCTTFATFVRENFGCRKKSSHY